PPLPTLYTLTLHDALPISWSIAVPTAGFPANVSWGALHQLAEHMPSSPGYSIRLNAAATLARRGSDHVSWATFREMLDPQRMTRSEEHTSELQSRGQLVCR